MAGTIGKYKKVSILGCGWLGTALARHLAAQGCEVKGSTTHQERFKPILEAGATPFLIKLLPAPEGDSLDSFLDADVLVISLSPFPKEEAIESFHGTQVKHIKDAVERLPINKVIYISSTSVYPDSNSIVGENHNTSKEPKARGILLAEDTLRINTKLDCTVLRCGGLMGYDRVPGRYFAGKKDLPNGEAPVNYVHRDDVVKVIETVLQKEVWNAVFNVVAPKHPSRRAVFLKNAEDFGFPAPTFDKKAPFTYRIVSSEKLQNKLAYEFIYPDPLHFPYTG